MQYVGAVAGEERTNQEGVQSRGGASQASFVLRSEMGIFQAANLSRRSVSGSLLGGRGEEDVGEREIEQFFLLADLLREGSSAASLEDSAVQLLRKDFQEAPARFCEIEKVRVGQILLLRGTLPPYTPLYDSTVDEDASVQEGWCYITRIAEIAENVRAASMRRKSSP